MKILGIETATSICSVGIASDGSVIAEIWFNLKNIHDRVLAESVRNLCQLSGAGIDQLDAIAVSAGPGSFTGLRIGMSVAQGLAFAGNRPIIPVGTLLAQAAAACAELPAKLASRDEPSSMIVIPLIKSRRGEFYSAKFRYQLPLPIQTAETRVVRTEELKEWLEPEALLCGNGVSVLRDENWFDATADSFVIGIADQPLSGGLIARIGAMKLAAGDYSPESTLQPQYHQSFVSVPKEKATQFG